MRHRFGTALIVGLALCGAMRVWGGEGPCTNDIDRLFVGIGSTNVLALADSLHAVATNMHDLTEMRACALKRHALEKIVDIPVSTNTFGMSYLLQTKAELLECAEWCLEMHLGEDDVRTILASASSYARLSTNDLERLRREASRRDEILYGRRTWGKNGTRRKNMDEWRYTRFLVLQWNESAEKYRRRLVAFAVRTLERAWADVPEAERRRRILALVDEYGLTGDLPPEQALDSLIFFGGHPLPIALRGDIMTLKLKL